MQFDPKTRRVIEQQKLQVEFERKLSEEKYEREHPNIGA